MAPNLKIADDRPCDYVSPTELYWRPILDKNLRTPLREKLRCARKVVKFSAPHALLILFIWGFIIGTPIRAGRLPRLDDAAFVVGLGIAVTLLLVRSLLKFWRTPVAIPRQPKPRP